MPPIRLEVAALGKGLNRNAASRDPERNQRGKGDQLSLVSERRPIATFNGEELDLVGNRKKGRDTACDGGPRFGQRRGKGLRET